MDFPVHHPVKRAVVAALLFPPPSYFLPSWTELQGCFASSRPPLGSRKAWCLPTGGLFLHITSRACCPVSLCFGAACQRLLPGSSGAFPSHSGDGKTILVHALRWKNRPCPGNCLGGFFRDTKNRSKQLWKSSVTPQQHKLKTGIYKHRFGNSFVFCGCFQGNHSVIHISDNTLTQLGFQLLKISDQTRESKINTVSYL